MKNIIVIFIGLFFLAASCEKRGGEENTTLSKPEKVKKEIDLITDSLNRSWNNMSQSDDQKLADVKRLLDEVSYTNNYNLQQHNALVDYHKHVVALKYDPKTMEDSKKIDQYDIATDSLLRATFTLVNSTPDIESHPIAKTLVEDIMKADNDLVLYRARYDKWVKQYNEYVDKHDKRLKKLGAPYNTYDKRPMFSLSK